MNNTDPKENFPDDSKTAREKLPDHMESPLSDINSKKSVLKDVNGGKNSL